MTVTILNESNTIKLIGSISRRGVKLDHDIWQAAASALFHAAEGCGDFTLFERVINALPRGSRVSALISWGAEYAPVCVNKDKNGAYKVTKNKRQDAPDWDLESIKNVPWWEYKPAPTATTVDLAALAEILRKIEEGRDTPTRKIAQDAREGAAYLRAALAAMTTKTVTVEKAPLMKVA